MTFAFGQTVTIVRGGAVTFPTMGDLPSTTSTDVDNCATWPAQSNELIFGQDTVTWNLELVVPAGTDLLATDQVVISGVTYDVVGQPMDWRSPFTGWAPGRQVHLQTSTG